MLTRTAENIKEAGKLYDAVSGMPLDKAAIAAMMADAFINGMNMQARLDADGTPQRTQA